MAEWLRSGLQIRARRFDSGSGLQSMRSAALAQSVEHIIRNDGVTGSNPVSGTILLSMGNPKLEAEGPSGWVRVWVLFG